MKYHHIFKAVSDKISEVLHIQDEATKELYTTIVKQLAPGNDYTFTEIMKEYLAEYQQKSFIFYHHQRHSGFIVNRIEEGLEVIEVNEDTRFVTGDIITHLSGDSVDVLSDRYRKLLFHDAFEKQEWAPLILKQHDAEIRRGSEHYHFTLNSYAIPEAHVISRDAYQQIIIYAPDQLALIQENINRDTPIILDLRYTKGIQDLYDIQPEIILISRHTAGSAEAYASRSSALKVGEETFGALSTYETLELGPFTFEYGVTGERTAYPDVEIDNEAAQDKILEFAVNHVRNI